MWDAHERAVFYRLARSKRDRCSFVSDGTPRDAAIPKTPKCGTVTPAAYAPLKPRALAAQMVLVQLWRFPRLFRTALRMAED